tara:strand:- start:550 stop:1740 length:1191 start_codon:yes stop_codon:yes gene_type:complete
MLDSFYENLQKNHDELNKWFLKNYAEVEMPFYGSVDIRFSNWKVSVVDANYFPAGFNNLSADSIPDLSKSLKRFLLDKFGEIKHLHLFPESHNRNLGYVENLLRLKEIIENAGYKVTTGSLELNRYTLLEGINDDLRIDKVSINSNDELEVEGEKPDLIILNNDLTAGVLPGLSGLVQPSVEMGWHNRKKSEHYSQLELLVEEVSEILGVDPWLLMPMWFVSENKCLEFEECTNKLAIEIDEMIEQIRTKYEKYGIDSEPQIFIKNDKGTYGLGIISIKSGEEIKNLSKRKIKRLTYGKGGTSAENFLIQEGVPTSLRSNSSILEPVGYSIGGKEMFWFFRSNSKKNEFENLNTPSSKFLLPSEVNEEILEKRKLDWYELASKLSFIAMGKELDGI